ncbi:DeoR/GlpR family DNA-binding transcription regulator [Sinorhizobium mexicanum]|uniref:DeoR/GlpR transcriptional regulator n=1 Tax=Sinorhizobium mexicanum TaxID=375549 RepID=A0A859QWL3_9HYPH|nr:DeoR/GlpR family DNA-binding transcription regulator [Sinorhizobium mexicanum]MBP1884119.1 DeoR/GlpR family transcriptional regulator of sugar metabolism [Sinorhizobium mexicanum]QLL64836.1 DeoR/GlpR transcriptional regulator [Sinorhizobium mexicanum]
MEAKTENDASESMVGLLSEPRRRRILEWLEEEGSARVRELAAAFHVSEATIRQDLERLENEGFITREHGGAYLNAGSRQIGTMTLHHQENMDKKRRIGALAASLVKDGETLILDAGTTTTEIAMRLTSRRDLTLITNALNIAIILGSVPTFAVHMPGGQFKSPTLSLSGDKSVEYFRNIFAGKLFLATAGVALDAGLTYPSFADLQLKEAMIKAAAHVYLVADSTKINKSSFTRLGSLDVVHSFITDDGISDRDAKEFERRGIEVLIAAS